jgi:hypothetical protein
MWRALSTRPDEFPSAQREFGETRAQVGDAIGTLASSGLLTDAGQRFVNGMAAAVERLYAIAVPPAQVAAAERKLEQRRSAARLDTN